MSGKYLDPKADLTFKKIFGEHEDLVMSLLNALLPLDEGKQIEHVEFLPPELVPENPGKTHGDSPPVLMKAAYGYFRQNR